MNYTHYRGNMDIQKIPNHLKIGEYTLFVSRFNKTDTGQLNKILDESQDITGVFVLSDTDFQYSHTNVKITGICEKEFKRHLEKTKIPNWVSKASNLEKIMAGNYSEIVPVTAEFVLTLNCNYRCVQCAYMGAKQEKGSWFRNNPASPELHMSERVMKSTLDKLAEGGVRNILFTGGGEPLMHPLTIQAMEHAKRNGNVVALYTNGRPLTKTKIRRILGLDPLFVRISVYGGNQKTVASYTQTTDPDSFKAVIGNIEDMAEEKERAGSKMKLGLSYLIHPITAGSIDEFAETILRMKHMNQIDYIRFTPAVDYSNERQHEQRYMEGIFQNIEENIAKLFESTRIKIKLYYHRLQDLNKRKSYTHCRASGWFVEVDPTGDLFLCCETHFNPKYNIGDLKTQSLDEIWRSDLRKSVIARVNDSNCSACPTLCKPNELNKVFDKVEQFRSQGKISKVEKWAKDLVRYGQECGYCPGKLDDFQS